jgi:hypothetical protein
MTGLKEKEELQNLNERLVIYIDTVRDLGSVRQLFERELEDTKR